MRDMIPPGCKTVLEPTPGEGNLVSVLSGTYSVTAPVNFWDLPDNSRFDCVVMNPPFSSMTEGYKILYRCMQMSDNIIALMPWLTIINSEKRTSDITGFGLVSVSHLPRTTFRGARVQCCLLKMSWGYAGQTSMNFVLNTSRRVV